MRTPVVLVMGVILEAECHGRCGSSIAGRVGT